jgi:hypothetical protein
MRYIATRAVVGAAVVAMLLGFGAVASAQGPNKCLAGKNKCASKKAQGILKCWIKAEKDGVAVDPICLSKAKGKFGGTCDGGVNVDQVCVQDSDCPSSTCGGGCFTKLEDKDAGSTDPIDTCLTANDATAMENKVDAFVDDVLSDLDPSYPGVSAASKCDAGKKKCVLKKMAGILKCHGNAVKKGLPLDPVCVSKARAKFGGTCDGGVNVDQVCDQDSDCPGSTCEGGCFTKLEDKDAGSADPLDTCHSGPGNAPSLEAKTDAFVQDVLCELGYTTLGCGPPTPTPTPTPTLTLTPTPTPTATCAPGPVFQGALVPTVGRFNYNATLGLPGANAACNSNFSGSHACTYFELQCAQAAGSLVGAMDTSATAVTSFWAIDPAAPALMQCLDDVSSFQRWEYATAHTSSRGQKVGLNNGTGMLGPLQTGLQCNFSGSSNVGCCQ